MCDQKCTELALKLQTLHDLLSECRIQGSRITWKRRTRSLCANLSVSERSGRRINATEPV